MEKQGYTVLVVDDQPMLLEVFTLQLGAAGFHTLTADTVAEARELLVTHPDIDLVLTDINMEDESGTDLLNHVRETYQGMPVAFFTGSVSNETAQKYGADYLLRKPVFQEQIAELYAWLDRKFGSEES